MWRTGNELEFYPTCRESISLPFTWEFWVGDQGISCWRQRPHSCSSGLNLSSHRMKKVRWHLRTPWFGVRLYGTRIFCTAEWICPLPRWETFSLPSKEACWGASLKCQSETKAHKTCGNTRNSRETVTRLESITYTPVCSLQSNWPVPLLL